MGGMSFSVLQAEPVFASALIAQIKRNACLGRINSDVCDIDGEKYFCLVMHPSQYQALKSTMARDKYKHEQWLVRYDRWRKSQGENPTKLIIGMSEQEFGPGDIHDCHGELIDRKDIEFNGDDYGVICVDAARREKGIE